MSKPRGRPNGQVVQQMSKEAQLALRSRVVNTVRELLEMGPMTASELARSVKIPRNTFNGYLRYMHKTLRMLRPTSEQRDRSTVWTLGEDTSLPTLDEELDRIFAAKRGTRPAVQVGMPRDPLVAALFGAPRAHHQ